MKLVKLLTVIVSLFATFSASAAEPSLDGYCPVCYVAAGKAQKGKAEHSSTYEGKTYLFVSEDVKGMFDAEPTKWLPQYNGYCAFGMALGKKFESDPTVFTVIDGKVYLNKDKSISKLFAEGTKKHIAKADSNWEKIQAEMSK